MSKKLTDEQVEKEIARLRNTDEVKLAEKVQRIKYKRRLYLSNLRYFEKVGAKLIAEGVTFENVEQKLFGEEVEETALALELLKDGEPDTDGTW